MPNDCFNTLNVRGSSNNLKKMKRLLFNRNNEFTFQITRPIPTELENMLSPAQKIDGLPDWYCWCIANWGTKWDADYESHQITNKQISISFCTAWTPPIQWLKYVCKKYPKLYYELSFHEVGQMFGGLSVGENGVLKNENWDLEMDPTDGSICSDKTFIMQGDARPETNDH